MQKFVLMLCGGKYCVVHSILVSVSCNKIAMETVFHSYTSARNITPIPNTLSSRPTATPLNRLSIDIPKYAIKMMKLIKQLLSVQYCFSKQGKNINLFTTIAGKLLGTVVFISDIGAVTVVVTRAVFVTVTVSDSRNVCNSLSRGNKLCQTRVFTMLLPRSIGVNCKRPLSIVFGCWWCYCC